jgi:hypothetical protein
VLELWPGGTLGKVFQPRVLALRYELGRVFSRDLFRPSRALWLGLRVADGLRQHLAKLSLRLRRLAREGFLPLRHGLYMGMQEGESKALRRQMDGQLPLGPRRLSRGYP